MRRLREERPDGRVAKVVLGEPVLDVILVGVVVPDRQSLRNLLALLQLVARRELLVEHPAREGIDEPASGPGENRLVIDLDDANLIRFVPRVEQRLGLVVVVGETVENPPAHHAVVPT